MWNYLALNVTIEIPKNSKVKYEYDRKTKQILVDRILYGPSSYPQNYGFIPEALDWDGDELDALVLADQPLMPGCIVPVRVLGAMEMIDDGDIDTKLITVIDCDPRYRQYKTLNDLPPHLLKEIQDFFQTYKNLQNKEVVVKGFKDEEWARQEYAKCVELMKKYGKLPKKEFLEVAKKLAK